MLRDHSPWMVDARGNTGTHGFILVSAAGPYVQQGCASAPYYLAPGVPVVGGTSEAREGEKLPSLLEEVIEASANIGAQESGCVCSASYVCVNDEIV